MQIFSKLEDDKFFFSFFKPQDTQDKKKDILLTLEFIQTLGRKFFKDFKIKVHKNNFLRRESNLTLVNCEALNGKILAKLNDIDYNLIHEPMLTSVVCIKSFGGMHAYRF